VRNPDFFTCRRSSGSNTRDTQSDRTGLTRIAPSSNIDVDIKFVLSISQQQWLSHNHALGLILEILLDVDLIDDYLSRPGHQENTSGGSLPLPCSVKLTLVQTFFSPVS